jgi:hypothetical protein
MRVDSSNISDISYSPKKKILTVDFHNGNKYEYEGVESDVYRKFKVAVKKRDSIGKLFSSIVRDKYKFNKVVKKDDKET